ncbi:hypothetical protein [Prosthecobacter sp.]|uniref:hypothetical protein n=1 Tax=Prosthecobacter sp. TaxID=1965333 RepID=UPI0037838DBE
MPRKLASPTTQFASLLWAGVLGCAQLSAQHATVSAAVEQAHGVLWRSFVDSHGIIDDYVGERPTPEDCKLGKPNAIGWWSPIENGPMFTGLYLPAACERARRSGDATDKMHAGQLAQGLLKCASVSDVPGFIARGVGTDGRCHYPLGSDDQTHPWFLGLHAYFKSGLPAEKERQQIAAKVKEVAEVLQSTGWQCPCDGDFKGQYRGAYKGHLFRDAVRYLYLLRATHEITGEGIWLERYQKALVERPANASKTRAEICAEGYAFDHEAIKHIDEFQLWIYVGCQGSLAQLVKMETVETVRDRYRAGLALNARNAAAAITAHSQFDNADTKVFGNADWRAVYSTWFPQHTQEEAAKLAKIEDKAKRGERKYYEAKWMRNPLAAAVIAALGGDSARTEIHAAICHYDYSRLHMAELFFAECAYYALPEAR